uniref:Uncharacterized protein n=1 Tax=Micrurus surinamensis TaxID=129470 RepID=A0A2D4PRZ8_MICSU
MGKPGDGHIRDELALRKHEMNIVDQEELTKKLQYIKQNHFEHANKPGRWLAYKLKKRIPKRTIYQLLDKNGQIEADLEKKKEIVREYFENLYDQDRVELNKIETYLKEGTLQLLSEDKKKILNKKITLSEIRE